MPDIDRDAMNRALHRHLLAVSPDTTNPKTVPDYCGSLDASVAALNALGLQWQKTGVKTVAVWRYGEHAEFLPADDDTPAALATALVQAALKVLGEEETDA